MIYWDSKKNIQLMEKRNISFEEITDIILADGYLDILDHPKRKNQQIYIIKLNNYIYAVPFIFDKDDNIVLKTAFPSRKFNKIYGEEDEKT